MQIELKEKSTLSTTRKCCECILLALLYFSTAKLGQLFAISPGNITPVWIPSGIILAALYFRGLYLLPGIGIGAFAGNAWAYFSSESYNTLIQTFIAGTMNGLGDMLCAYIGVYALFKYNEGKLPQRSFRSLAYFFVYASFLGSLISAVFGVGTMGLLGIIPLENVIYAGYTWLVGDMIGVLLIGSILFVLLSKEESYLHTVNIKEKISFLLTIFSLAFLALLHSFSVLKFNFPHYVFLPLLAWGLLRIGEKYTFRCLLVFAIVQLVSYLELSNQLDEVSRTKDIIELQMLISITVLTLLIINIFNYKQSQLNLEIHKMKDDAIQANYFKTRFISAMNHEIRTPLNGIVGLSEVLSESELNSKQSTLIEDIKKCSNHLIMLTDDILDISKIEKGKFSLNEEAFSMSNLLESIKAMFQKSCQEKGIDFVLHPHDTIPKYVIGDEVRIRQVLVNLVSNAIKYTTSGYIKVEVKCPYPDQYLFSVVDTGVGIAEDQQKLIFKEFEQADHTHHKEHGGFGLGLFICNKLLSQMNSKLEVKSQPKKGATFQFQLNLAESQELEKGDHIQPMTFENLKGTALVVDDNLINLKVSCKILSSFGLEVEQAKDGQIAYEMTQKRQYDFILMDCQMPVLNGFDATRKIRQIESDHTSKIPIVALTANATEENLRSCIDAGMNSFLTKPITKEALYKEVCPYFLT